jgi:parallel beta-helix repeat protein
MNKALAIVIGLVLLSAGLVVLVPQGSSVVSLTPHDPIRIDNDTDFATMAASEGWAGGGTLSSPYRIDDLSISGGFSTDPLYIGNTTVHFVVAECSFSEADDITWPYLTASGVTLFNVTNGEIWQCTFGSLYYSITLNECDYVVIDSNGLIGSFHGIGIYNCMGTEIVNNDFATSPRGIQSESSNHSSIRGNMFSIITEYSVVLAYSDNNTVMDNTFSESPTHLMLDNAKDNIIEDNRFSNSEYGVKIQDSDRSVVRNNTFAAGITQACVEIYTSDNCTVEDNNGTSLGHGVYAKDLFDLTVRNNSFTHSAIGVYVSNVKRVLVERNTCTDNTKGIEIYDAWYMAVRNNTCQGSSMGISATFFQYGVMEHNDCSGNNMAGLYTVESHYNMIRNNDFSDSDYGIWLSSGDSHSTIRENNCTSNSLNGIRIGDASENMVIHNIVRQSVAHGLYVYNSNGNFFYFNIIVQDNGAGDFFDPTNVQAYDPTANNFWNSSDGFGNYWRDWRTPDSDKDGIVDIPYSLDGAAVDFYPLASFVSSPRNLTASAGDSFVDLSWNAPNYTASSPVRYYKVYRENPGGSVSTALVLGGVMSYHDASVTSWRSYAYHVTAINIYGEGPASNDITVLIPDHVKPSVTITYPENDTYGTTDSMLVEWDGSDVGSGVSHYEIMLDGGLWLNVENDTNYTYTSLSNGTHVVTVKVVDNASNSNTDSVMFKIGKGTISGRIMSSGQPVVGANVSLETGEQTTTDSDGYFTLEAYAGSNNLKVSKEGYDQVTRDLTLEPGQLMDLGQMEMKKSGMDLTWAIIAIVVIAAVATLIVVVLRARRH